MKSLFMKRCSMRTAIATLTCFAFLLLLAGCKKGLDKPPVHVTTVASGLEHQIGLEVDKNGNIFVSLPGTGNNDAKVVAIRPNGRKYDAIVNLASFVNKGGEILGGGHLLLDGDMLYVLSGVYLYKADISGFKPGDAPMDAGSLPFEDIGSFVLAYPFQNNAFDSHPYNLTKGPGGDLYIADAGANAILHRESAGVYSVLAEIPGIANPTPVGPPQIQSVPTGIHYDGKRFLVTTLLGFPFPAGMARIYSVSTSGAVALYKTGLTSLVDICEGNNGGNLVLEYAVFGQMGFAPNTGSLTWTNGTTTETIISKMNMPIAVEKTKVNTWYINSMGDGTVLKVSFH